MYNVSKWPNILLKSCGAHTVRLLKYVWPFYNIMHEKVNSGFAKQKNSHKRYWGFYLLYKLLSFVKVIICKRLPKDWDLTLPILKIIW